MDKKAIKFSANFGFLENFDLLVKFWIFWIFFRLFLDLSVIFLDFSNALSDHCTIAWVTRPERPKNVKDEVKQARRAAT